MNLDFDGKPCVLLSSEAYERVRHIVEYDDGPLTDSERRYLLEQAGRRAGWEDPEMSIYDECLKAALTIP